MTQKLKYPKYNADSIDILVTKSDNCYNFNDVWDITKDQKLPLFVKNCEGMSYDKSLNPNNLIYTNRPYKKFAIKAKDSKIRLILDNTSQARLISQFVVTETETSIK